MKTAIKAFLITMIVLVSLTMASCPNSAGGMRIGSAAGGGAGGDTSIVLDLESRAVWMPDTVLKDMIHHIILQGPTGIEKHTLARGQTNARFAVVSGFWKIIIQGIYEGDIYTFGSGSVVVKEGQTNRAPVLMDRAYQIGNRGPAGGIIFYVADGWKGRPLGFTMADTGELCFYLEAAPQDIHVIGGGGILFPVLMCWDNNLSPQLIGGTGKGIGTGRKNTASIIRALSTDAVAAIACRNYTNAGYDDWFLPSIDELEKMSDNLDQAIPRLCTTFGGNTDYWSSTEYDDAYAYDYHFDFQNLSPVEVGFNTKKDPVCYVRPVRAF